MPCYHPLRCYQSLLLDDAGKRPLHFGHMKDCDKHDYRELNVKCGQCIGCRLDYSRQWAVRCMHEASLYQRNCFITLTYDDAHLPRFSSLDYPEFQRFIKRLRFRFPTVKIRYYAAGEYGELSGRPHYHALLFNHDFDDKEPFTVRNGHVLSVSRQLADLWIDTETGLSLGFTSVGALTFESAAYVARYVTKKVTGKYADLAYAIVDTEGNPVCDRNTGEVLQRARERSLMSLKPGIGYEWYKEYGRNVYDNDRIVIGGREMRPPRYYDIKFKVEYPYDWEFVRMRRDKLASQYEACDLSRLYDKEFFKVAQTQSLVRCLN